ncbi:MAG: DUF1192 domain-containing protein [Hyphomicrobiales bacterium]|nr:DUF1192 family protein [Hyphomicrobiales bacterium]MDE2018212.1 DUF1192 domain-containing protein [Hyphomicrobiales bacterium]MDE2115299.1 DUF1192 domain-containing protein [Hyphomicrobiales bacterium]
MAREDDDDPFRPKAPPAHVLGEPIDTLSVGDLDVRIAAMEAEIARLKAARAARESSKRAADAFFGKRD